MLKQWVAIGLAIALVADIALFFGIGFGVGALVVAAPVGTQGSANYVQSNYTQVAAMYFSLAITSYSSAGVIPTTATSSIGQSTVFSGTVTVWDPTGDNCANAGDPVFAPYSGSALGQTGVQITYGTSFQLMVGGQLEVSTGDTYFLPISAGIAGSDVYACINWGGGDHVTNGGAPSQVMSFAFTMVGLYSPSRINIAFVSVGDYCDTIVAFNPAPICVAGSNALGLSTGSSSTGQFNINAGAAINTWSGQAFVTQVNPGSVIYNGGTISLSVSTGFDGPGAYTLSMNYPAARGNFTDSAFPPKQIPDFCVPGQACSMVTWTVPAGTAQPSTVPGWNVFIAILTANGGTQYVQGYTLVNIDISPTYQPATPSIVAHSNGKFINPQVGDTEVVTVFANQSASSGSLSQIILIAYYATTSSPAGALPPCGAQWVVGSACPSGSPMAIVHYGNGLEGTFQFLVNPPPGITGFWLQSYSESNLQQASNASFLWVTITPSNCVAGMAGCPSLSGNNIWEEIGPYLLVIAFILTSLLLVLLVPLPMAIRWGIPIAVVAAAAILLALNIIQPAFVPGGLLNAQ